MNQEILINSIKKACEDEFSAQNFMRINERPIEYSFVFQQLLKICPKTVLDVGTGTTALPHLFRTCGFLVTAIDNITNWPQGMINRHFHVINDDITSTQVQNTYDFISCISVLEHIQDFNHAISGIHKLLNPGGHAVLTFPYNDKTYVPNVYKLDGAGYGQDFPYICQVFSRNEIDDWQKEYNFNVIEQQYWRLWGGEFWTFGRQIVPPLLVSNNEVHQLTCILLQKGF